MKYPLEELWSSTLKGMREKEDELEKANEIQETAYSGLKDIGSLLELVQIKFQIALLLIDNMPAKRESSVYGEMEEMARDRTQRAVRILDELAHENISEDQKEILAKDPAYKEARELLQQLLLKGGAFLFEARQQNSKKAKILSKAVADSLEKYSQPDDRYRQLFKTEELPSAIRKLVNLLFSALAPENPKKPPFGIEFEEELYSSEKIKMPLSQAIYYIENELLPGLRKSLENNAGNPLIQRQIRSLENRAEEYKRLKFIPRSNPVLLDKGFHTDWISSYTADGELLVNVALPVTFKSGTNVSRVQELVQAELTRRIAGKGICPELDEEYRYLKRLESGTRGNSRLPSFKVNTARGFRILKSNFPALKKLERREDFIQLMEHYRAHGKRSIQKFLTQLILSREQNTDLLT